MSSAVVVPAELAATHRKFFGAFPWIDELPGLAKKQRAAWRLCLARHGLVALILPVVRDDGSAAVLKLKPVTADLRGAGGVARVGRAGCSAATGARHGLGKHAAGAARDAILVQCGR